MIPFIFLFKSQALEQENRNKWKMINGKWKMENETDVDIKSVMNRDPAWRCYR